MSYLGRLIDHSGMAIGERPTGAREATPPQPLEVDALLEAQQPDRAPVDRPAQMAPQPPALAPAGRQEAASSESGSPDASGMAAAAPAGADETSAARPAEMAIAAPGEPERPGAISPATPPPVEQTTVVEVVTVPAPRTGPRVAASKPSRPREARAAETVAAVRAWVAATPAPDELAPATSPAVPTMRDAAPAEPPPRRRSVEAPLAQAPDRYETSQNVHVTIGNIVVTVEAPPSAAPGAAPPAAWPAPVPRRDVGASTRLRRHYLRP